MVDFYIKPSSLFQIRGKTKEVKLIWDGQMGALVWSSTYGIVTHGHAPCISAAVFVLEATTVSIHSVTTFRYRKAGCLTMKVKIALKL